MAKKEDIPEEYRHIDGVFSHTLLGRTMWFKLPIPGQFVLLRRYQAQMTMMRKNNDPEYTRLAMDTSVKTLNVIDSQFLDPDDRDFVEEAMIAGKLDVADVLPILAGGAKATADDEEVEVKPRPARALGKPVKKTVANAKRDKA